MAVEPLPDIEPVEDTLVLPLLLEMVDCLCNELAVSPGGLPCYCGPVPGQFAVMDYCDCTDGSGSCGTGFVRVDRVYPSRSLPQQTNDFRSCQDPLAARFEMGVYRCLPGMDRHGNPPGPEAQAEAVRIQMGDRAAMYRAIQCCIGTGRARPAILDAYVPSGPLGDCGGGTWRVTVQLT